MVKAFGIWQIEDIGIIGKDLPGQDYIIPKNRLWETTNRNGILLYDWPVHLSEKTWMTEPMFDDLINAMVFAQEHFASENTGDVNNVSWNRTTAYAKKNIGH
jgi:hypothetical protein